MSNAFQTHGAFSWCELMTDDVSSAKKFYRDVLGWELEDMDMPTGPYTVIKGADGQPIGGMMKKPENVPMDFPPNWGTYVTVDDVDDRITKAKAAGALVLVEPTDVPGVGRFAVVQDPTGAVLSLITYSREQAEG